MNAQRQLGDEDFELLEIAQKVSLQGGNESTAAARPKVQGSHDNDSIDIGLTFALPNSAHRKLTAQRRYACKPRQQLPFNANVVFPRNWAAVVECQRQVYVVTT